MNAHTPFDANQDWTNPCCQNSSNDPMVDALLGNAYHVVRAVYCNLGNLKLIYDFLNQYGMVLGVQSEAELKALTTKAKYARIYGFSRAGDRQVTDYLYVEGDHTGIIPDNPEATGSWITVATSGSSGGGGTSSGEGAYIPWVYANGSATGGETTINVPDNTVGVPFIIVNGDMQYVGRGFEFNADNLSVTLAQPLEEGDEVVFLLTGTPAVPDNPNISDWIQINWLYNNGAAVGGEQVIAIPYTFQSIPAVYKNGLRLYKGLTTESYTADPDNQRILLTEPLATNDRLIVQIGGEAQVLETSDHTLQEVARATNVKDSEVILSTDTTKFLNGKKIIYSVSEQKSYGLPVLPTNIYVQSVANGKLTYNPGSVEVDLLPVPSDSLVGLETFKQDLSKPEGVNFIGEVASVAGFANLPTMPNGSRIVLKGWGQNSTLGGGVFYYDSAMPKASHDGGCVISQTVPYTSPSDYVNGVGEADPDGNGCWVRAGVMEVNGLMYGLGVAGITNHTAQFNKMVTYAATNGYGIQLPSGTFRIGAITIPVHQRAGGLIKYFKGKSEKETTIEVLSDTTSTSAYGLHFFGSLSVFSSVTIGDFTIKSVTNTGTVSSFAGYGLYLEKCIRANVLNVNSSNFEVGCLLKDTLYLSIYNSRFTENKTGIQGRLGEVTGPNSVHVDRCDFSNNAEFCIEMQHAHAWTLTACCFEGNGGKSYAGGAAISFNSCVQFAQVGGAGQVSANFNGCYFETNAGRDITFYVNRDFNQIMNIDGCIFNYNSDTITGSRVQVNSSLTDMGPGKQAILNMKGNGFYNAGTTSTAYREVQFAVPSTFQATHLVFNDAGNKYALSSPFTGMEKVQRLSPGEPVARVTVGSTGVASQTNNVSAVTKTGTGVYTITFTADMSTRMPIITFLDGSGRYGTVVKTSALVWTVSTFNNTGAAVDLGFNLAAM